MNEITMEFARQDDCLDNMVPSDLRQLIGERDRLRAALASRDGEASPQAAVPDTHRVVSVALLESAVMLIIRGFVNAEISDQLRAIIDNKEKL
jgi:hypothetical protein